MTRLLQIRDVVTVRFPEQNPQGHEQEGLRPAIVVGIPNYLGNSRFQVIIVVPLTSDRNQPWVKDAPELYPCLPLGIGGLRSSSIVLLDQIRSISIVLLDQIRSIDVGRVVKYRGSLTFEQYAPIMLGLQRILDFGQR